MLSEVPQIEKQLDSHLTLQNHAALLTKYNKGDPILLAFLKDAVDVGALQDEYLLKYRLQDLQVRIKHLEATDPCALEIE